MKTLFPILVVAVFVFSIHAQGSIQSLSIDILDQKGSFTQADILSSWTILKPGAYDFVM